MLEVELYLPQYSCAGQTTTRWSLLFPFIFHGFLGLSSDGQAYTSALVYHLTVLVDWVFVDVNFLAIGTVVYFDFLTKE